MTTALSASPETRCPPAYRQTLLGQLDERFLGSRPVRVVFAVVLMAAVVVPSIQFVHRIQETDTSLFREGGIRQKTALGRWLPTAELLASGEGDPYGQGHWFPTPPLILMSLVPFSKMGYLAAGTTWSILKIAGLAGTALVLLGTFTKSVGRVPVGVLMIAAAFSIRPIISDIQHGNLNIFMMIWITLAWCLYLQRWDRSAGFFLALAIVTKVTPALLLVYFLYRREWRVVISSLLSLVLLVIVIPGIYLGFDRNLSLLKSWFDMLVAPYARYGWVTMEIANQSLYGVILRLFSNAGLIKIEHMSANLAAVAGMEDMARPVTFAGRLIRPVVTLTILAALAWLCRGHPPRRTGVRPWLQFALVLIAMLLLGERTWKHHATTLPLVFVVIWYVLTCRPWSDRFRAVFVAGLGAQLLMLVVGSEGFLGDELAEHMLDGGLFCWGLLLCGIQIGVLIARFPPGVEETVAETTFPAGPPRSVPAQSPQS